VNLKTETWVAWFGATLVACAILISFVFTTFSTKTEAAQARDSLDKRLDRIEAKLDSFIEDRR
jgi:hypothetical protein